MVVNTVIYIKVHIKGQQGYIEDSGWQRTILDIV